MEDVKSVIEKVWHKDGYTLAVVFHPYGYRCGYVGVPKTSYFYNRNCENMYWEGETTINYSKDHVTGINETDKWFIGFSHHLNAEGIDTDAAKEYYGKEYANELKHMCAFVSPYTKYLQFVVEEEVEILYKQIREDEKIYSSKEIK